MTQTSTLHILNGTEMYHNFKEKKFLPQATMVPFNEAMCHGETCEHIFSDEFNETRAKVHGVTQAQYDDITLQPLQPLFEGDFSHIALWFDEDMFCQINVLTVLAWLDQQDYRGTIDLHLVDHQHQPVSKNKLNAGGYAAIYKQVMIHKTMPENVTPKPLQKGIQLYLNYLGKDSDLMRYIVEHQDVPAEELVPRLIEKFTEYGLGDRQYLTLVNDVKSR
ncbi:AraC family transcriptional regulator [Bacillus sp. KH172YL63]|uniref:AraC family transcriptional regulator n=1 Tax=Bacillus sp. KH172YL63 TaxID=2709784 RepID=UPI0013E513C8|nr:AraC family transcriptional regulator [Bacillus sp. KH172YL63]BCB05129.1 hypothetical protein KH172YL63_32620 [Bacillus sp. KH172YL63]